MVTASVSGSPSSTDWQQELTSALYNITGSGDTVPTTWPPSFTRRDTFPLVRVFLVLVSSATVLFNAFVLAVLYYGKQSQRTSSNVFLVNQIVSDLLSTLTVILNLLLGAYIYEYRNLPGAIVLCIIFEGGGLLAVCTMASVMNNVVLTLERYFKIVHPIKHRQKFRPWMNWVGVAIPWIDGVIIGIPTIAATTVLDYDSATCRPLQNFVSSAARQVHAWITFLWHTAMPLAVFIVAYSKIFSVLRSQLKVRPGQTGPAVPGPAKGKLVETEDASTKISRSELNVLTTVVFLIVVHLICWLPMKFYIIIIAFGVPTNGTLLISLSVLMYLNPFLDPIVYATRYDVFKQSWAAVRKRIKEAITKNPPAAANNG